MKNVDRIRDQTVGTWVIDNAIDFKLFQGGSF